MNTSEKMIHRQNQPVDPMFTFFTVRQKLKAYYQSKLNFRRGRVRAREKQREKECDADEERKIISCPLTWFYPQKIAFKTS